jgi:hypothetical protein
MVSRKRQASIDHVNKLLHDSAYAYSLVHVLMKQNKSSDNNEVNIKTYNTNYIYFWLMHATLQTTEGSNDSRNYKKIYL